MANGARHKASDRVLNYCRKNPTEKRHRTQTKAVACFAFSFFRIQERHSGRRSSIAFASSAFALSNTSIELQNSS